MDNRKVSEMFDEALEIARECGLKPGIITDVKVNGRLSRSLGRCRKSQGWRGYHIEISKQVVEHCDRNFIVQTLLHEIIHTCEGCWNHGANFEAAGARIMAKYPEYKISQTNDPVMENKYGEDYLRSQKYLLKCEKCGMVYGKSRMSDFVRHPEFYTHKGCGGNFTRIK